MITIITEQKIEELEWFIKEFKEQKEEIRSLKRVLNSIKNVINISLLEPVKPTKPSKIENGYNIDGKLIVSMKDLEGAFTWDEAMEFCSILSEITGRTFTLPTGAQVRYEYDRLKGKHHPWWYNYYWCLDLDSEGNHVAERGDGLKIHDTSIISLRVVEN